MILRLDVFKYLDYRVYNLYLEGTVEDNNVNNWTSNNIIVKSSRYCVNPTVTFVTTVFVWYAIRPKSALSHVLHYTRVVVVVVVVVCCRRSATKVHITTRLERKFTIKKWKKAGNENNNK